VAPGQHAFAIAVTASIYPPFGSAWRPPRAARAARTKASVSRAVEPPSRADPFVSAITPLVSVTTPLR
jgi:hypothetical protein